MTEFTTCDECGGTVPADTFDQHGCITDPRNGPYDLDRWDVDDSDEEAGA
jgi:hypothetical protein